MKITTLTNKKKNNRDEKFIHQTITIYNNVFNCSFYVYFIPHINFLNYVRVVK